MIVKAEAPNPSGYAEYKQLDFFRFKQYNLSNSQILLYEAKSGNVYRFNPDSSDFIYMPSRKGAEPCTHHP